MAITCGFVGLTFVASKGMAAGSTRLDLAKLAPQEAEFIDRNVVIALVKSLDDDFSERAVFSRIWDICVEAVVSIKIPMSPAAITT